MKIQVFSFLIFVLMLSSGCAVLTKNQVKYINAYAASSKSYVEFPGEIFKKRAELHLNNELLEASQFSDPVEIDKKIVNARQHFKSVMSLSDKFDLSLKLLQQYSGLLAKLSADNFTTDLNKSTQELGENLTGLVGVYNSKMPNKLPAVVGTQIAKVILIAGSRLTRHKQARELKRFIPAGDVLVQNTVRNLTEVLDSDSFVGTNGASFPSLKALIKHEQDNYISNYKIIILSNRSKISYGSMLTYNAGLTDFDNIEILRQKSVEAAKKLARAHAQLVVEMKARKKILVIAKETQDLIADLQQLTKIATSFVKMSPAPIN